MSTPFETNERILVFPAGFALDQHLGKNRSPWAAPGKDGREEYASVLSCWDDTEHTRMRAASFPETIDPIVLSDGRMAVIGLWSKPAMTAWQLGDLPVQELTPGQLDTLRVKPVEPNMPQKT